MEMKNMTVADLAALTASDAPAPGGGSISAMAGAYGAGLVAMVANLTIGKKKYEEVWSQMQEVIRQAGQVRAELMDDMQKDTAAFDQVMAAMALPKGSDAEKAVRMERMQLAMKAAAEVPLAVAKKAAGILPLARLVVEKGNPNTVTDGLCGAMMCRTAVLGALYNVKVNLLSVKDAEYVEAMRAECHALQALVEAAEAEIRALATELA